MTKRKKRKPQNPPREVLERMATAKLTPVGEGDVKISKSSIEEAIQRLREVLPEIFEDEEEKDSADEPS